MIHDTFLPVMLMVESYNNKHYAVFNSLIKSIERKRFVKRVKSIFGRIVDLDYLNAEMMYSYLNFYKSLNPNDNSSTAKLEYENDNEKIIYSIQYLGMYNNGITNIPKIQIWKSYTEGDSGCVQVFNFDKEIITKQDLLTSNDLKNINNCMYESIVNYANTIK